MAADQRLRADDIVIGEAPTDVHGHRHQRELRATRRSTSPPRWTTTCAITDADGDTVDAGAALARDRAGRPGAGRAVARGVGRRRRRLRPARDSSASTPIPIGDEEIVNFTASPPFVYNGLTYDAIGVDSNGYLIVGGGERVEDIVCCPPGQLPDPDRRRTTCSRRSGATSPATGVGDRIPTGSSPPWPTSGRRRRTSSCEWRLNAFGTDDLHVFQVWIGLNGVQDITFNYDPENHDLDGLLLAADDPVNGGLTVGAENEPGTGGDQLDTTRSRTPSRRSTSRW